VLVWPFACRSAGGSGCGSNVNLAARLFAYAMGISFRLGYLATALAWVATANPAGSPK
jgi:hypothetical protein